MRTTNVRSVRNIRTTTSFVAAALAGALGVALLSGTVQAGHNGSPALIQSAIASGSADAIEAELERSEYLVCAACTDMVLPLVDHLDYGVRKAASWWLARRGIRQQVTVDMLNRLAQPDSTQARNAADVLGEFANPSTVPALSAALSNPIFTGEARAAMAKALGSINMPSAAPALTSALGDSSPAVKAAALLALQRVGIGFTQATLAEPLLTDADEQVRAQAALTFGMVLRSRTGVQASSVQALVNTLANDPSALVRQKAAWSLGEIGASASLARAGLQQAAASDASPFVRSLARAAIGKLTP
jgi:HEAT repeat protein